MAITYASAGLVEPHRPRHARDRAAYTGPPATAPAPKAPGGPNCTFLEVPWTSSWPAGRRLTSNSKNVNVPDRGLLWPRTVPECVGRSAGGPSTTVSTPVPIELFSDWRGPRNRAFDRGAIAEQAPGAGRRGPAQPESRPSTRQQTDVRAARPFHELLRRSPVTLQLLDEAAPAQPGRRGPGCRCRRCAGSQRARAGAAPDQLGRVSSLADLRDPPRTGTWTRSVLTLDGVALPGADRSNFDGAAGGGRPRSPRPVPIAGDDPRCCCLPWQLRPARARHRPGRGSRRELHPAAGPKYEQGAVGVPTLDVVLGDHRPVGAATHHRHRRTSPPPGPNRCMLTEGVPPLLARVQSHAAAPQHRHRRRKEEASQQLRPISPPMPTAPTGRTSAGLDPGRPRPGRPAGRAARKPPHAHSAELRPPCRPRLAPRCCARAWRSRPRCWRPATCRHCSTTPSAPIWRHGRLHRARLQLAFGTWLRRRRPRPTPAHRCVPVRTLSTRSPPVPSARHARDGAACKRTAQPPRPPPARSTCWPPRNCGSRDSADRRTERPGDQARSPTCRTGQSGGPLCTRYLPKLGITSRVNCRRGSWARPRLPHRPPRPRISE